MAKGQNSTNPAEEFDDPLKDYGPKPYRDSLEQALAEESVVAIQTTPVATIESDAPTHVAVKTLAGLQVACLLVEHETRLVGVFSDRDVLERVALEYDLVKDRPVSELMTSEPVVVYDTDSAGAALSVMAVCGFRHVPVTNLDGKVIGVISPQRVTEFLRKQVYTEPKCETD
jgi:CBS domain-containing protein